MAQSTSARPAFIINVEAGSAGRLSDELWQRIRASAGVCEVHNPTEIPACVAALASRGVRRLIVAGGDGSIHGAINGLAPFLDRVELAIFPAGTGNDLARGIGLPLNELDRTLDIALHGTARPVDLVRLRSEMSGESRLFVNMCYGGFGGRVADEIEQSSKVRWGFLPYWVSLVRKTLDLPEYEVQIVADGAALQATIHGVLFANSCFLGGGVPAAPTARIDDGMFDAAIVPVQSFWEKVQAAVDLLRGQLHENENIILFRASNLRIDAAPEMKFTADGEPAPPPPLVLQAMPRALSLVVSGDSPAMTE